LKLNVDNRSTEKGKQKCPLSS